MDTSKEYIKMCDKAIEIQKDHKIITGDFYFDYRANDKENPLCWHNDVANLDDSEEHYGKIWDDEFCHWLPRQDQLQEMMPNTYCILLIKIHQFLDNKDYFKLHRRAMMDIFTSMEQLWFAFVMKEKYNKIWNGKDWR